ncbi:hypothetical protein [Nocardioides sp. NPDC006273]|uniref:hypothetical protein n=1 Tax=Nocardioides sp. NPDC006273 TaxID=3155598 RepID=UPI0033B1544F
MTDPIERLRRHNPVDADRVRSAVPPRERQLLLEEIMSDETTTRRRHRGWLVPAAAAAAVAVIAVGVWAATQPPEITAVPAAGPPAADESSQAPTSGETLAGGTPSLGPAEPEMEVEDPCPAYEPTTVSVPQVAQGKQLIVDAPGWTGVDHEGAERWTGPGGEVYVTSTGGDPRGNDKYCTRFTGETRIAGVEALSGAVPEEGFVFAVTPPIGESSGAGAAPSILIESTTLDADEFAAVLKSLRWVGAAEFDRVVRR